MTSQTCRICHTNHGYCEVEIPFDEPYTVYICDTCWDTIATIVFLMIQKQFPQLKPMYNSIEEWVENQE